MIPTIPQILAVDDSKLVRIQVRKAFIDYEVKFIEAENGECLHILRHITSTWNYNCIGCCFNYMHCMSCPELH